MKKLIAVLLLIGVALTFQSIWYGLRAGPNADVHRQWITTQYVKAGINPYASCYDALYHTYGTTKGPDRIKLKELKIYDTSNTTWDPAKTTVIAEYGPPTATYPPSSLFMLYGSIRYLPGKYIHAIWAGVNILALLLLWRFFKITNDLNGLLLAAGLLAWPATQDVFKTNQFSLLTLLFLLFTMRTMENKPIQAGVWLSLALIKPSFSLLFLLIPLLRRNWMLLGTVALIHGLSTLAMSWMVHASPWDMISTWLAISRYMLQGAYSIQEILNRLEWENTTLGFICTFGFLFALSAWAWWNRKAGNEALFNFLSIATLTWTYHERYDYVILLPVAVNSVTNLWTRQSASLHERFKTADGGPRSVVATIYIWILSFFLLGLAITDSVYLVDSGLSHILRWAGRFALARMLLRSALDLKKCTQT